MPSYERSSVQTETARAILPTVAIPPRLDIMTGVVPAVEPVPALSQPALMNVQAPPAGRLNRINIGQVDVQVHNHPATHPRPGPATPKPVQGAALDGRYLDNFCLKP